MACVAYPKLSTAQYVSLPTDDYAALSLFCGDGPIVLSQRAGGIYCVGTRLGQTYTVGTRTGETYTAGTRAGEVSP